MSSSKSTTTPILFHILSQLRLHRRLHSQSHFSPSQSSLTDPNINTLGSSSTSSPAYRTSPLFVALQGPQGSGKTYLTSQLRTLLTSPPHNLHVAVLSIDDLYLPYDGLKRVADDNPGNKLLEGRGLPGTHDMDLGRQILERVKTINDSDHHVEENGIQLPVFDKSMHNGFGDRLPPSQSSSDNTIRPPLDILILEGWCVGFHPTTQGSIDILYEQSVEDIKDFFDLKSLCSKRDVMEINERLKAYVEWWSYFDVFIQIKPPSSHPYSYIYKWRLQQEHNMKSKNGGKGMSDDEVKKFIDRYIPGYIFFSGGIHSGYVLDRETNLDNGKIQNPKWLGRSLQMTIKKEREVVGVEEF